MRKARRGRGVTAAFQPQAPTQIPLPPRDMVGCCRALDPALIRTRQIDPVRHRFTDTHLQSQLENLNGQGKLVQLLKILIKSRSAVLCWQVLLQYTLYSVTVTTNGTGAEDTTDGALEIRPAGALEVTLEAGLELRDRLLQGRLELDGAADDTGAIDDEGVARDDGIAEETIAKDEIAKDEGAMDDDSEEGAAEDDGITEDGKDGTAEDEDIAEDGGDDGAAEEDGVTEGTEDEIAKDEGTIDDGSDEGAAEEDGITEGAEDGKAEDERIAEDDGRAEEEDGAAEDEGTTDELGPGQ